MVSYELVRLWLPKRINGKLYWLKEVMKVKETKTICLDGKYLTYTEVKYKLI